MSGPTDADLIAALRDLATALPLNFGESLTADAVKLCNLAADRLAALTAAGAWTAMLPTKPGWYWHRNEPTWGVRIVWITASLQVSEPGCILTDVELLGGEWRGPLSPDTPPPVPAAITTAALDAFATAAAAKEWLPIETLPKATDVYLILYQNEEIADDFSRSIVTCYDGEPRHVVYHRAIAWSPLPAVPDARAVAELVARAPIKRPGGVPAVELPTGT